MKHKKIYIHQGYFLIKKKAKILISWNALVGFNGVIRNLIIISKRFEKVTEQNSMDGYDALNETS